LIKPVGLSHWPTIKEIILSTAPISRTRLVKVTETLIQQHYGEHKERSWFTQLTNYFVGQYVLALEISADPQKIRKIIGSTKPTDKTNNNTVRGLISTLTPSETTITEYTKGIDNLIHGSDSEVSAACEIELWFETPPPPNPKLLCLTNHKLEIEGAASPFLGIDFDLKNANILASHVTDLLEAMPWNSHWQKAGNTIPKIVVGGLTPVSIIGLQYLTTLTGQTAEVAWINPRTGTIQSIDLQMVKNRARRHRK
jgi:nucleoside-diphosphate kinase